MRALKLLCLSMVCVSFSMACVGAESKTKEITMQLQEEGWVTSETAAVTVSIQAASSKNNVSLLMAHVTEQLTKLVHGAVTWHVIQLSTQKNSAGLFAVSLAMSARLTQNQVATLQANIDSLNKAGEQYKIESVDYQPTLAEISAKNTELRRALYQDVLSQQKIINESFPGAHYQLYALQFEAADSLALKPMLMFAGNVARQSDANSLPFSQQLMLTAKVTFSADDPVCQQTHD